jgi:hypothetical protein
MLEAPGANLIATFNVILLPVEVYLNFARVAAKLVSTFFGNSIV